MAISTEKPAARDSGVAQATEQAAEASASNLVSSARGHAAAGAARRTLGRVRGFWARVTEGAELQELWSQFLADAKTSYGLYSRDVNWEQISGEKRRWKRPFLGAWALFQTLLMKLTPARRVLLLVAVVLVIVQPHVHLFSPSGTVNLAGIGTVILFLLLALELADRVTMKRDLEIAREIQQWLVPAAPPKVEGIEIAFATLPQNTVAGDYFDAFLRPAASGSGRSLFIAVADVAGKSVPAALLMATFQASLRALCEASPSIDENVVGLDRYACAHSLGGRRFTTAFLADIDPISQEMRYVNAGHNSPILRRASGQIERLEPGSPPFGLPLFGESGSPHPSACAQLRPAIAFLFSPMELWKPLMKRASSLASRV